MSTELQNHPTLDADYAIIEQITNVVDGDFLGPLQGISSRLKEIFNTKLIGIFVFDLGFKQFVEFAYSLDRNTEKILLLNEITINTNIILENIKKMLGLQTSNSENFRINIETISKIETFTDEKLSMIFSELLSIKNNQNELLKKTKINSCQLIPILQKNKEYISLLFMFKEEELSDSEKKVWNTYYNRQLDLVVQHVIDIKGLYLKATHDELTGIYNKSFGITSLEQYIFLFLRKNLTSLSIIFIDIDNFKQVNDNHGHKMGDQALVKFCEIAKENIRRTDLFMRFGGEEFCIVLPDSELDITYLISQRIGHKMKNYKFKHSNDEFSITLSIGISIYNKKKNEGSMAFIDEADQFMYKAKKAGKDRICFIDDVNELKIKKIL